MNSKKTITCSTDCKTEDTSNELACKLTSPELQERKNTVLKSIKSQIIEKKEQVNDKNTFGTYISATGWFGVLYGDILCRV